MTLLWLGPSEKKTFQSLLESHGCYSDASSNSTTGFVIPFINVTNCPGTS